MKDKLFSKLICIILAALFSISSTIVVFADEKEEESSTLTTITDIAESSTNKTTTKKGETTTETTTKSFEEQKAEIQKKIEETNKKLEKLEKKSTATQEYVDTLDQKIGYINEELTVLQNEATEFEEEITTLTKAIKKNKKSIKKIQKEVDQTEEKLNGLSEQFEATYELYCKRMRALYISGDLSIIGFLLSSGDISTFLTRYQMVKNVSESDAALLKEIEEQETEINKQQSGFQTKKTELENKKMLLDNERSTLKSSQSGLNARQEEIAIKKAELVDQMNKSDSLLYELNQKNYQYTEYKWQNQQESDKIEAEMNGTLDEYLKEHKDDKFVYEGGTTSGGKGNTDSVLNMTYPVPGHYSISATFGNHGYSSGGYHGGIDFPCSTGSTVVAAQSGTVICVQSWNGSKSGMQSYGNMVMIYHGTDSNGRSITTVYAHNSSVVVNTGDTVKKGQKIAKSGSTGNSTGPHCHFEVRINGSRVNPSNYLTR